MKIHQICSFALQRPSGRQWAMMSLLLLLLWLPLDVGLIYSLTPVHIDNFQCVGPVAGAEGVFQPRWPMMAGFAGHDEVWGFHWFGAPYLRSIGLIFHAWDPLFETLFIAAVWGLVGVGAGEVVRRSGGNWVSCLFSLIVVLFSSTAMIGNGFFRPEFLLALLVTACVPLLWRGLSSRWRLGYVLGVIFILPLLHPLGLVLAMTLCGVEFLVKCSESGSWRGGLVVGIGCVGALLLGVFSFFSYYIFQPVAGEQLLANLDAQAQLPREWTNLFSRAFGGRRGLFELPVVGLGWAVGFWWLWQAGVRMLRCRLRPAGWQLDHSRFLLAAVAGASLVYGVVGKVLNPTHFVAVLPVLAICGGNALIPFFRGKLTLIATGFASVIALFAMFFFGYRTLEWVRYDFVVYRDMHREFVRELPDARLCYLPVSLWEAAYMERRCEGFRLSTFPNLGNLDRRLLFEENAFADLQKGDLLVLDLDDQERGVFANVENIRMRVSTPGLLNERDWEVIDEVKFSALDRPVLTREYIVLRRMTDWEN